MWSVRYLNRYLWGFFIIINHIFCEKLTFILKISKYIWLGVLRLISTIWLSCIIWRLTYYILIVLVINCGFGKWLSIQRIWDFSGKFELVKWLGYLLLFLTFANYLTLCWVVGLFPTYDYIISFKMLIFLGLSIGIDGFLEVNLIIC